MPPPRRRVALLVETSNAYARDLLHGIRSWMRQHQAWSIRLVEHGRGAHVPSWLSGWKGDGIIARVENAAIAQALRRTQLPVVDVSAALPSAVFPRVSTDSEAVTQLAVEHLVARGLKHFGYCGESRFLWSHVRAESFRRQLRVLGFACSAFHPAAAPDGEPAVEDEVQAIAAWLRALPKPVGVLACYDIRGQQVLDACHLAGLKVPDEVAVIGVHNDELLCELCDPPLTSVIPNARRAGYVAAKLLARMMTGKKVPLQAHTVAPLGVAARQSTDVVAVGDAKLAAALRFIRERAPQRTSVRDVLKAVPMARTLLERKFRQYLDCTVHEHIEATRLEFVRGLLVGSDLSIGEIAQRAGFEHAEYMSVAFRRWSGLPPREYRARHRLHA
jgi:LacI family transcriptional regulator